MSNKEVLASLEGGAKSSGKFQEIDKIATTKNPALFAMKTYESCVEQIESWSTRFEVNVEDFAICGCNTYSEKAMNVYSNKDVPSAVGKNVRFILTTQAAMQKNNHLKFFKEDTLKKIDYCQIVVDEFDFSVLIPSLDYELNGLVGGEEKQKIEQFRLNWIGKNYTSVDVDRVKIKRLNHDRGFIPASWVIDCEFPMIFLTSEVLATEILQLIGFEKKYIGVTEFKDCVINVFASPFINNLFIEKMNHSLAWNKMEYDLLICDRINKYFQNDDSLNITAISHTAVRGSNKWRDKKILTILTHIPQQFLLQIQDTFKYFGVEKSYEDIVGLFYRDRLCQATGRVIGYRGGKSTDVFMHSSLLEEIEKLKFPYTINKTWIPNFDELNNILEKVKSEKNKIRTKNPELLTYSFLEDYFFEKDTSYLQLDDLREYCANYNILNVKRDGVLPSSKIAKYFDKQIKVKKINGKSTRVVTGLAFKK